MKIRTDFVSNSSSSSMIISNCQAFDDNLMTKKMIFDALVDLYGKEAYEKKCKEYVPFQIYDLKDPNDKKAAEEHRELLSGWTSRYTAKDYDTGKIMAVEDDPMEPLNKITRALDSLDIVDAYRADNPESIMNLTKYNRNTKQDEPVPDYVKQLLMEVWTRCGVLTNAECLDLDISRFFIHFDDNEMHQIKGMTDPGKDETPWTSDTEYAKEYNEKIKNSKWKTEAYSIERFYEILIKYFAEKFDLFDPEDEDLLEKWCNLTITFCGHEG